MTTTSLTGLTPFIFSGIGNVKAHTVYDAQHSPFNICLNFNSNSGSGNKPTGGYSSGSNIPANEHVMVGTAVPCTFNAISVQGRGDADQWITSYKIQYSLDGVTYSDYNGGSAITGTTGRNVIVTHHFSPPIVARSVKFCPLTFYGYPSWRMELYGKCNAPGGSTTPNPMERFIGKKVNLKSIAQDAFVRDNNGVIDLSANQKKLEEWTVEDVPTGKVCFLNSQFKNKYLSLAPGSTTLSHADKSVPANIEWTPVEKSPGVFTFKSSGGSNLRANSDYEVLADNDMPDPEHEFEIVLV